MAGYRTYILTIILLAALAVAFFAQARPSPHGATTLTCKGCHAGIHEITTKKTV